MQSETERSTVNFFYALEAETENLDDLLPYLEALILEKAAAALLDCRRRMLSQLRRRRLEVVGLSSMPKDVEFLSTGKSQ